MTGEAWQQREGKPEYPAIYRLGAYLLFAWLSFCSSVVGGIIAIRLGVPRDGLVQDAVTYTVMVSTFLTLRDMTKRDRR